MNDREPELLIIYFLVVSSSPTNISRIILYRSQIKLKEPFIISLGPLEFASNVIVEIQTGNGLRGFGECSPFLTIHGESIDTGMIIGKYLAGVLLGKNPIDIRNCISLMENAIFANSCIKSAFDIALYDLVSKQAGMPLYHFLGGKNDKVMHTDFTVSLGEKGKMVADAVRIKDNGFRFIKVKLGEDPSSDLGRINAIRQAVGSEITLRIDANQGWNYEDALTILNELNAYGIQHCEEPIPRWDFMRLASLRKKSPVQIMADESCFDHRDAERLISLNACDRINVKLGKSGGLFNAIKIIRLAEKANLPMQAGGFLESRLGFTATAHMALCSDQICFYDFDSPLMFESDPVTGGIIYGAKGLVTVPESEGLGASFDPGYLKDLDKVVVR